LVQITHYTSPNYTDHSQANINWIHGVENFFTVQDFCATYSCPEKQCLSWKFSLYWIYLWHSGFFNNLHLPWKTERGLNSLYCMYIFITTDFCGTCACPEKQSLPWKFSLYWIYFWHSGFFSTLRLPWKPVCSEFTVLNIYFISLRIFEQLTLALKTEISLKIFTVLNTLFTFRIFEQLALALKSSVPWNFSLYWNIFYHWGSFSNLLSPWKTECALKFFTLLKYFLSLRIFEQQLRLPRK